MSKEEIARALEAQGVPRDKARQVAGLAAEPRERAAFLRVVGPELAFPIRFVLPWSALASDNDKYVAQIRRKDGGVPFPFITLTEKYRAAKNSAKARAAEAMTVEGQRFPALASPLSLVARVWVPDNRPGHDVANFAKCAHDALEGVVYAKDEWLHDVRWIRAGVDVDRPRAELEIAPL